MKPHEHYLEAEALLAGIVNDRRDDPLRTTEEIRDDLNWRSQIAQEAQVHATLATITEPPDETHQAPQNVGRVDPQDPEFRQRAILFNDLSRVKVGEYIPLSYRKRWVDYLYDQGWRREERPEDINSKL